ncbi:DUF2334 domain-containing protein [Paenibacillus chartarius]|uniref:DUF2334 domain-containing protein n=1 Tax=Paenibacillus chartarius TaxID=747481 RepID=A0ABV6DKC5_9BACL
MRTRRRYLRLSIAFIVLVIVYSIYPYRELLTVSGETAMPKFVLMRLEDVGPGGQYGTLEGVGRLRAVLEYMQSNRIAVHIAVVPRWINIDADGTRSDRSLDDPNDAVSSALRSVLAEAEARGASLGLHGYTHQVGDERRADGFHESGIGNEFHVEDVPATDSVAFAEDRVQRGLAVMRRAALTPRFWEAPHYHTTPDQDQMFRRYFGLLYQADVSVDYYAREAQYRTERQWGGGLGAVNVPTPFSYIAYDKDENAILSKLGRTQDIASFFYHPFLEFPHLQAVADVDGEAQLKEGIPVYRYPERERSVLQKLSGQLKAKGYAFYSIHDYIPFTPASSVRLGEDGTELRQLGDVDGSGKADLIRWVKQDGTLLVASDPLAGTRGEPQREAKPWGIVPYAKGSSMTLCDSDRDGRSELWIVRTGNGGAAGRSAVLERYDASGGTFKRSRTWTLGAELTGLQELFVLPRSNGETVVAGVTADQSFLKGLRIRGDSATPLKPYAFKTGNEKHMTVSRDAAGLAMDGEPALVLSPKDSSLLVAFTPDTALLEWKVRKKELDVPIERGHFTLGDFNGDGREDVLHYDTESQKYGVYLQGQDGGHTLLSTFGPWGRVGAKVVPADLDGNGKCDIALLDLAEPFADAALSYETTDSPAFHN